MLDATEFLSPPVVEARGRLVSFGSFEPFTPKPHKDSLTHQVRGWCLEKKTNILTLDVAKHFDLKPIAAAGILAKLRDQGFLKITEELRHQRGGVIFVCEVA